jgi:hypothetical protein
MRNLLLLFSTLLLASSCSETIETNTPALQGEVDNVFFRAVTSNATINTDGSVTISGETALETIEVTAESLEVGTYLFGSDSNSEANFTTFDDAFYTTDNSGNGKIVISNIEEGKITATFNFNARRPGINDTLNFQEGIIYEVPITNAVPGDGGQNNDQFTALVDGANYTAVTTQTNVAGNTLFIIANNQQNFVINLSFPLDTATGDFEITEGGDYRASYAISGGSENAISGMITITTNDNASGTASGSFQFETTSGIMVTNGNFTLTY